MALLKNNFSEFAFRKSAPRVGRSAPECSSSARHRSDYCPLYITLQLHRLFSPLSAQCNLPGAYNLRPRHSFIAGRLRLIGWPSRHRFDLACLMLFITTAKLPTLLLSLPLQMICSELPAILPLAGKQVVFQTM
jgi:hypothetical protein